MKQRETYCWCDCSFSVVVLCRSLPLPLLEKGIPTESLRECGVRFPVLYLATRHGGEGPCGMSMMRKKIIESGLFVWSLHANLCAVDTAFLQCRYPERMQRAIDLTVLQANVFWLCESKGKDVGREMKNGAKKKKRTCAVCFFSGVL